MFYSAVFYFAYKLSPVSVHVEVIDDGEGEPSTWSNTKGEVGVNSEEDEEDEEEEEEGFFIPLTFPRVGHQKKYVESDPEWQAFERFSKDKEWQRKVNSKLFLLHLTLPC